MNPCVISLVVYDIIVIGNTLKLIGLEYLHPLLLCFLVGLLVMTRRFLVMTSLFLVSLLMRFIVATRLLMFLPTDLVGLLLLSSLSFSNLPKASQSIFILGSSISSNKVVFVMHHYRITPENFFGGLFGFIAMRLYPRKGFS